MKYKENVCTVYIGIIAIPAALVSHECGVTERSNALARIALFPRLNACTQNTLIYYVISFSNLLHSHIYIYVLYCMYKQIIFHLKTICS